MQGRWTYLNADESLFCRYQEICLNAHIKCEQYARFSTGNFFNFNGTGGVWRKACIDDAGGWNARTLVEDMARLTPPYTPPAPLAHPYAHRTHPRTPSHTLAHPYTPSHTLTHPYTPLHTLTGPLAARFSQGLAVRMVLRYGVPQRDPLRLQGIP